MDIKLASCDQAALSKSHVDGVYFGSVRVKNAPKELAFVKFPSQAGLIAELVSAKLASGIGLKVPQTYLLIAETDQGHELGFASRFTQTIGFGGLLGRGVYHHLHKRWPQYDKAMVFDEWIANGDRNTGNILYDGKHYWLIDHGQALTGPAWLHLGLNPNHTTDNLLLDYHPNKSGDVAMGKLALTANNTMVKSSEIDLHSTINSGYLYSILKNYNKNVEVVKFLNDRIQTTAQIICQKIGINDLFQA